MRFNNKNVILPEPQINYLCFEALESGVAILLSPNGYYSSFGAPNLEYSLDTVIWNSMTRNLQVSLNTGEKIYFRGENPNGWSYGRGEADTGGTLYWNALLFSARYNISGNIMTLIDKTGTTTTIPNWYCFLRIFSTDSAGSSYSSYKNVVNADNLVLPATSLQPHCYLNLFNACSLLTSAKFSLPALVLAKYCYDNMFLNANNLVDVPVIYATTLASYSCEGMFYYTSVNKIIMYASDISASNCLINWLNGVPSSGDFYNLGGANYPTGASGIPTGWTIHTSL